jgi:hypothetical protein
MARRTVTPLVVAALLLIGFCLYLGDRLTVAQGTGSPDRTQQALQRLTAPQRERARIHATQFKSTSRLLDEKLSVRITQDYTDVADKPLADVLKDMVCRSDGVFVGSVNAVEVNPTEDGTFLFSDYMTTIIDVVRTTVAAGLQIGQTVVVSRPGGETTIDGVRVAATINTFPPLVVGSSYLFFVRRNAQAEALLTLSRRDVFEALATNLRPIGGGIPATDTSVGSSGLTRSATRDMLGRFVCR